MRRNDRLDVIDLLVAPTDALRHIRRKADRDRVLSRAEWTVVAHLAQQGTEMFAMSTPTASLLHRP